MTDRAFTESVVEETALAWMEATGREIAHGPDVATDMPETRAYCRGRSRRQSAEPGIGDQPNAELATSRFGVDGRGPVAIEADSACPAQTVE